MTARVFKVPDINSKPRVTVAAIWVSVIEEGFFFKFNVNNEFNCNKTVYFQKLIIYFLLKGYVVVISFICFMTSPCNTKRLFSSFVVCVYFTWNCLDMIYFILLYISL